MAVEPNVAGFAAEIAVVADEMRLILAKSRDLYNRYFDTGISTVVNAVTNDGDPVPATGFDKGTMLGMVTVLEQSIKFMDNQVVAQNTYRITVNKAAQLRDS